MQILNIYVNARTCKVVKLCVNLCSNLANNEAKYLHLFCSSRVSAIEIQIPSHAVPTRYNAKTKRYVSSKLRLMIMFQ